MSVMRQMTAVLGAALCTSFLSGCLVPRPVTDTRPPAVTGYLFAGSASEYYRHDDIYRDPPYPCLNVMDDRFSVFVVAKDPGGVERLRIEMEGRDAGGPARVGEIVAASVSRIPAGPESSFSITDTATGQIIELMAMPVDDDRVRDTATLFFDVTWELPSTISFRAFAEDYAGNLTDLPIFGVLSFDIPCAAPRRREPGAIDRDSEG